MFDDLDLPTLAAYVAAGCWITSICIFAVFVGLDGKPRL